MKNKITCNNYTLRGRSIRSGNVFIGNSLDGEELAIDTFEFRADLKKFAFMTSGGKALTTRDGKIFMCNANAGEFKFGDIVRHEHGDTLIGKFYLKKPPARVGKTQFDFISESAMGLLDKRKHYGGVYEGTPAGDIIAELFGDIPYTIDSEVAETPIYNWLPVATCRENLHQVLFAIGAGIFKDLEGDVVIKYIETIWPVLIDADRIYIDGQVDEKAPATRVDVTEYGIHALDGDQTVTLHDSSEYVESKLVSFDQPCHDLEPSEGLTIEESGANYAIVSGVGTLTGKAYTITQRVVSRDTGIEGPENVFPVEDCTLINAFNSYNVALRVAQYCSEVSETTVGLVVGNERPATEVEYINPFGETETGYIKSLSINLSAKLKAIAEIARGFLPSGQGNIFDNYDFLTGSGEWVAPDKNGDGSPYPARFILVNPGSPGNPGQNGQNGSTSAPGNGGAPGEGGNGGKILIIDIMITPGAVKSYSCAEVTIFDGISASAGMVYANGYSEPKTGLVLGKKGPTGELSGGAGSGPSGPGPDVAKGDTTFKPGPSGSSSTNYGITAYGGWGGGAASAGDGQPGQNGTVAQTGGYSQAPRVQTGSGSPSSDIPSGGSNDYSDWQASYSFNSSTGTFSTYGGYGFIIPTRLTVYKSFGTYCLVASIAPPSHWYTFRIDRTGSPVSGKTQGGGGGDGGPGAPGADATGYGEGGHGGDGGGGGGASRGYEFARTGQGGPGGPGGDGGPGCIIAYY